MLGDRGSDLLHELLILVFGFIKPRNAEVSFYILSFKNVARRRRLI
jgi:hypothetical protein